MLLFCDFHEHVFLRFEKFNLYETCSTVVCGNLFCLIFVSISIDIFFRFVLYLDGLIINVIQYLRMRVIFNRLPLSRDLSETNRRRMRGSLERITPIRVRLMPRNDELPPPPPPVAPRPRYVDPLGLRDGKLFGGPMPRSLERCDPLLSRGRNDDLAGDCRLLRES